MIRDSYTKEPLNKEPLKGVFVHISGIDKIIISNDRGEYFRLLSDGPYYVTFQLALYENTTIYVLVDNPLNHANVFNVEMTRDQEELKKQKVIEVVKELEDEKKQNRKFIEPYKKLKDDFETVPDFKYHNYDEMLGQLVYYHQKYKNLTHLYRIQSLSANETRKKLPYAFVISKNPASHELLKPEFKFSANSVSDQWIGKELLLLLIKHLLESYGKNKTITELVDTTRIHIVPSLDPESTDAEYQNYRQSKKSNKSKKTFKDAKISKNPPAVCKTNQTTKSIDLIFPDMISKTDSQVYEDLIRFLNWFEVFGFLLSGTLYDGQMLARIPYNTWTFSNTTTKTEENDLFKELAYSYVEVC